MSNVDVKTGSNGRPRREGGYEQSLDAMRVGPEGVETAAVWRVTQAIQAVFPDIIASEAEPQPTATPIVQEGTPDRPVLTTRISMPQQMMRETVSLSQGQ